MTRRTFLVFLLLILVGGGLAFWLWPHEQETAVSAPAPTRAASTPPPAVTTAPSTNTKPQVPLIDIPNIPGHPLNNQDKQNISQIYWMTHIPISFYGKVIDQDKEPVVDADITYSAADRYFASGDKYRGNSDENGLFSITGIQGMGLSVEVKKDGYYQLGEKSMRGFHAGSSEMPTQDHPAIFELRKRGEAEKLIMIEKNVKISRDGTPTQMNLATGHTYQETHGDIQVQAWTNDASVPINSGQHYDWRCKITVLGGGLQPRTGDEFDFVAPTDGYQPTDEIVMPANSEQWRQQAHRSYFLRLGNGEYARIDFNMAAGGEHFFNITSYLNPTPGHTNLEYDPKQKANP